MAKTIKVRTRPGAPVTEQPAEQAKQLIEAGLWFAADEKKAGPTEQSAPQPTGRKSR